MADKTELCRSCGVGSLSALSSACKGSGVSTGWFLCGALAAFCPLAERRSL